MGAPSTGLAGIGHTGRMQPVATDTRLEVSPAVAHAESGDQVFVLPLGEQQSVGDGVGSPIALDGSAHFVWRRLLAGPASVSELATAAAAEYGVSVEQVRDDIHQFVESLLVRGVLRPAP